MDVSSSDLFVPNLRSPVWKQCPGYDVTLHKVLADEAAYGLAHYCVAALTLKEKYSQPEVARRIVLVAFRGTDTYVTI